MKISPLFAFWIYFIIAFLVFAYFGKDKGKYFLWISWVALICWMFVIDPMSGLILTAITMGIWMMVAPKTTTVSESKRRRVQDAFNKLK
jgi:hypothetical protein